MAFLPPSNDAVIPTDNASICAFSVAGSIGGMGNASFALYAPSKTALARARTSPAGSLLKASDALISFAFGIGPPFCGIPRDLIHNERGLMGTRCAIRSFGNRSLEINDFAIESLGKQAVTATYRLRSLKLTMQQSTSTCYAANADAVLHIHLLCSKRRCSAAHPLA